MHLSTLLPAAAGALAVGWGATSPAAPTSGQGGYVIRAVPASNGPHDVFKRFVKVPRHKAAAAGNCAATTAAAAAAMCDRTMGEHPGQSPAPKG